MSHPHFTTVLRAVQQHPGLMSPIMLEYLLRGETIGRMEEKGLLQSPYLGVLSAVAPEEVASCVADVLGLGWIGRAAGFYPSLRLTAAGAAQLRQLDGHPCQEA
ncbi:MAG: hypothetical protein VKP62_09950, partial [Candidatus Sericytochromatia bacterium]|nr:hypothetical protein [Candidatus Sericytochromatia bacterium]